MTLASAAYCTTQLASADENRAAASSVTQYTPLLIGLLINDKEVSSLDALVSDGQYFINVAELMPFLQTTYQPTSTALILSSPAGDTQIPIEKTQLINNEIWLNIKTLNRWLYLNARFDQSKYALSLTPPWQNKTRQLKPKPVEVVPDIRPNAFSFNQFRLEIESESLPDQATSINNDLILSGAAAQGSWRLEMEQMDGEDWQAETYYWLKQNPRNQWLVGHQSLAPSVLSTSSTMTGVQVLSSNRDLPVSAYDDISQSNFHQDLGDAIKTFKGKGSPGSLAQLYVNGQLFSQTFVRIDGQFQFDEVQLPSSLYSQIEIIFIDPLSKTIIEERNVSRTAKDTLLSKSQRVTSIALGEKGNLLDTTDTQSGFAGMASIRQGLSDKTTIEAAYAYRDGSLAEYTAGITQAFARHYVAAAQIAQNDLNETAQIELDGSGKKWRLSGLVRELKSKSNDLEDTTNANLYYNYSVNPKLNVQLEGQYRSDKTKDSYLLPGFVANVTKKMSLSAKPDAQGDYKTDLRYSPNRHIEALLTHQKQQQSARLNWRANDALRAYYTYQNTEKKSAEDLDNKKNTLGIYWRPDTWQNQNYLRAQVSQSDRDQAVYDLELRFQLIPGINMDLQLSETESGPSAGTRIMSRLTMDYAYSGQRLVPAQTFVSHNTNGSIIGKLFNGESECQIEEVNILVGRATIKAPLNGCQFRVGNLPPGLYQVSLDNEGLPIEFVTDNQSYLVEIGASSVSTVDFRLHKEFGVAGRIQYGSGDPLSDAQMTLFDDKGVFMAYYQSDQFGYYRIDGMVPGDYEMIVRNAKGHLFTNSLALTIKDNFLFDQNIVVSDSNIFSYISPVKRPTPKPRPKPLPSVASQ